MTLLTLQGVQTNLGCPMCSCHICFAQPFVFIFFKRKIILLMSTGDCFSVKVENIPFLNESKGFCCSCWKKYWPVPFVPTNSFLFFFSVVLCWFQKVVTSCINLSVEFEVLESDQCDVVHLPKQDRPTS